ncbi:MAG: serine hydrolase domain-containing protein [Bacteroidota bacterium]
MKFQITLMIYFFPFATKVLSIICFLFVYNIQGQSINITKVPLSQTTIAEERLQKIDNLLNEYTAKQWIPGAVALVAHKGEIVYHKAFGEKHLEKNIPLQTTDIFRLASMSKCITSVALMILYEEGKFLLDDPVSWYIPEFEKAKVAIFDTDTSFHTIAANKPVTIRHLLTHTSGIGYGFTNKKTAFLYQKKQIPDAFVITNTQLAEKMKILATQPLLHHPGEKWTYGLNTDMVGYLVEVLSGQSLDEFIQERIFTPLKMGNTHFYLPDEKSEKLVPVYGEFKPNQLTINDNSSSFQSYNFPIVGAKTYYSGGSGLCGTAKDYYKFGQMLLNGGIYKGKRILSPLTINLMTTNQLGTLKMGANNSNFFGLGFAITSKTSTAKYLVSEGRYGWTGYFKTTFWIDPQLEIVAVLLTQTFPSIHTGLFEKFENMVNQSIIE